MRAAVEACTAADQAKRGQRDELKAYLAAPLEAVENIVAWWEVGISCFLWNHGAYQHPATLAPIPSPISHG